MQNKFIVFSHIEKNGGITLHNILHKSYLGYVTPRPDYGEVFNSIDLINLQKVYPIKIDGIGGHRITTTETYRDNQFLFTFLRNPVERYLSHLNFQISKMGINWNIEEFLENPYFDNFQTFRISKTKDLDQAIEIINKNFSFIGLMEDYDNSLLFLSILLNNPLLRKQYVIKNVSIKKEKSFNYNDLKQKYKDKIIENNKIDIALYEYVKNNVYSNYKIKFKNFNLENEPLINNPVKNKLLTFKRKISTFYVGRFVQPFILKQSLVAHGY